MRANGNPPRVLVLLLSVIFVGASGGLLREQPFLRHALRHRRGMPDAGFRPLCQHRGLWTDLRRRLSLTLARPGIVECPLARPACLTRSSSASAWTLRRYGAKGTEDRIHGAGVTGAQEVV